MHKLKIKLNMMLCSNNSACIFFGFIQSKYASHAKISDFWTHLLIKQYVACIWILVNHFQHVLSCKLVIEQTLQWCWSAFSNQINSLSYHLYISKKRLKLYSKYLISAKRETKKGPSNIYHKQGDYQRGRNLSFCFACIHRWVFFPLLECKTQKPLLD